MVLCVLGSGKKALLDSISRRSGHPRRGHVLLNGVPMSLQLFQESCGYVTSKSNLLPGLTVEQTLHYSAQMTLALTDSTVRKTRVKQVMYDAQTH